MKSNFKLAPISCHCKLNVLIPHLKRLSAQKARADQQEKRAAFTHELDFLLKRYI